MDSKDMKTTKALQHIPLTLDEGQTDKLKKKIKKIKRREKEKMVTDADILKERGVVLLSHIPKYFVEPQMYKFFTQFGEVTRIKLLRSKKTGNSQGFAFIEFEFKEIAKVVAETMNNYLMFERLLKCKFLEADNVKEHTFANWDKPLYMKPTRSKAIREHNIKSNDDEKVKKRQGKTKTRRLKQQAKLNALGLDYNISELKVNENFVQDDRKQFSKAEFDLLRMKKIQDPVVDLETTKEAVAVVDEEDDEIVMKVDEKVKRETIGKEEEVVAKNQKIVAKKKTVAKKIATKKKAVAKDIFTNVEKESEKFKDEKDDTKEEAVIKVVEEEVYTSEKNREDVPMRRKSSRIATPRKAKKVETTKKVDTKESKKSDEYVETKAKKVKKNTTETKPEPEEIIKKTRSKREAKVPKRTAELNKTMATRSVKKRKVNSNKTL